MNGTLASYLDFFRAGLLKHGQTGGIVPSQRFLIARMIAPVPRDYQGQVIEFGAGSGALTLLLAARCPKARILACDINPTLAQTARDRLDKEGCTGRVQVLPAPAEHLLAELSRPGSEQPDFIISGIPLGNLGPEKVGRLLDGIQRVLRPDGIYIQFQHSLMDRKAIQARFPKTRTVPVLLNFPPAFVYFAQSGA
jgi:phospholipid N-methyltransferase